MLELREVTKRFGRVTAVDGVSLTVPAGQMLAIIGRSGAGKSTLLRLVNRLHDPSSGQILFDGSETMTVRGRDLRAWRSSCAMIFQQFNLVDRLDVLTNVLVGRLSHRGTLPTLFKLFTAEERARAILALHRLGVAEQALQRAETLSGGQQQRVAIARALVQEPRVLLADEPIASLDPANAHLVMEALRRINREDGLTVVCNLHQVETARTFCDRIVGMAHGRIVFDGLPGQLDGAAVRAIYGAEVDERHTEPMLAPAAGAVPAYA